jgi:hypothetical protein
LSFFSLNSAALAKEEIGCSIQEILCIISSF